VRLDQSGAGLAPFERGDGARLPSTFHQGDESRSQVFLPRLQRPAAPGREESEKALANPASHLPGHGRDIELSRLRQLPGLRDPVAPLARDLEGEVETDGEDPGCDKAGVAR
jgi:hypothetical protein